MIKEIVLKTIRLYQRTLSPDHSWNSVKYPAGFCRYYPSCSEYAYLSITREGLLKGIIKAGWRILRCNPLAKGGVDLPYPKTEDGGQE